MNPGDILSHAEMCQAEGGMLQRGMTFRAPPHHGVILMSQRPNAPYQDALDEAGNLLYEGHDAPRTKDSPEPKQIDQPRYSKSGRPTENGKFADWTDAYRAKNGPPARFHVYEKVRDGIWTFRGTYLLDAYQYVLVRGRRVFRFVLAPTDSGYTESVPPARAQEELMLRRIPTWVKQAVYKRDKGQCVECGAKTELHFDHDFPFSKGGTGLTPDNVRVLCARHNLAKGGKVE